MTREFPEQTHERVDYYIHISSLNDDAAAAIPSRLREYIISSLGVCVFFCETMGLLD